MVIDMAGKLRRLFMDDEIIKTLTMSSDKGAAWLTSKERGIVSRQLLNYWQKQFLPEHSKSNGTPYVGTTIIDRDIRGRLNLRVPSRLDDSALIEKNVVSNSRILFISDQHAPYHHPDTIQFLTDVSDVLKPTRIINLGDETDGHGLSMHDSDPSLDAAGPELVKAQVFLSELADLFPVMELCHSNHGSLVYRRAMKAGIPAAYIKTYREFLFPNGGADGWSWHDEVRLTLPDGSDLTARHHFTGNKNQVGHGIRSNVIQGHEHGKFYIVYDQTTAARNWSVVGGCLIDPKSHAFAYGKLFEGKPIVGTPAVINSQPILIHMPLDEHGRYTGKLEGILG